MCSITDQNESLLVPFLDWLTVEKFPSLGFMGFPVRASDFRLLSRSTDRRAIESMVDDEHTDIEPIVLCEIVCIHPEGQILLLVYSILSRC